MDTIDAGGLELAYERAGSGPLLVLLHGAAGDHRVWEPQLACLADEFTVVAWDEPGAGRSSDLPEGFVLDDYADVLGELVSALGLGPAHVVGHSWGGTVALAHYRRHPAQVASLTMVGAYAGWKGSLPPHEVRSRVAGTRQMLTATTFDPTMPGLFADTAPERYADLLARIAHDVRPATLERQLAIMAETDLSDVLGRVAVPTLLLWGRSDVRSPLTVAGQFAEAIDDTTLVVVDGAGHMCGLEQPDHVNAALRSFVRAQASARGAHTTSTWPASRVAEPVPFEVYRAGVYLHGTKAELEVGDLLVPGRESNFEEGRAMNHVYFTETLDAATWGAELAAGEGDPRIYVVEPTGDFEDDPNVTDKRFAGNPTRSFRSREPLRVVGELLDWVGHAPEKLEAMRTGLEAMQRAGSATIED